MLGEKDAELGKNYPISEIATRVIEAPQSNTRIIASG